jgi:hypothetical protein
MKGTTSRACHRLRLMSPLARASSTIRKDASPKPKRVLAYPAGVENVPSSLSDWGLISMCQQSCCGFERSSSLSDWGLISMCQQSCCGFERSSC